MLKTYSKDLNKTPSNFKMAVVFNKKEESFVTKKKKKRVNTSQVETKELSPEDVVIEQAQQDNIGAAYGALIKKDPAQAGAVLLDFAKQKYGLDDHGGEIKGPGLKILNKKIESAITKTFPGKKSVLKAINKNTTTSILRNRSL